jgi:hypothetical protein
MVGRVILNAPRESKEGFPHAKVAKGAKAQERPPAFLQEATEGPRKGGKTIKRKPFASFVVNPLSSSFFSRFQGFSTFRFRRDPRLPAFSVSIRVIRAIRGESVSRLPALPISRFAGLPPCRFSVRPPRRTVWFSVWTPPIWPRQIHSFQQ